MRLEQNQREFRYANEKLEELSAEIATDGQIVRFLCECPDDRCLGGSSSRSAATQTLTRIATTSSLQATLGWKERRRWRTATTTRSSRRATPGQLGAGQQQSRAKRRAEGRVAEEPRRVLRPGLSRSA
jgi:hypothetical protein